MHSNSVLVSIDKITSFETILTELTELEARLSENNLKQFLIFNKAYSIVTSDIKQAADDGYFKNPQFIEKFTVWFAQYYFQAVNYTATSSRKLPPAWAIMNKTTKYKNVPNFITLLMGANAHINNDLPLAFLKQIDKKHTDELFTDVLKVDKLLMKSGRQIIDAFEEPNQRLNLLKRRLIFLYYRPVMYMILYWRIRAWRNYKSIKKDGIKSSGYTRSSVRIAGRFSKLAKYLS
jgi:hypothetical protein